MIEEPTLAQCDHCCRRYLLLTGFNRQQVKNEKVDFSAKEMDTDKVIIPPLYVIEWNYCSEECKNAHIKQCETWTPDKQRASLQIQTDQASLDWIKRHNLKTPEKM